MDPRIQQFYDNAAAKGLTPGEYAVELLGEHGILWLDDKFNAMVEDQRQEGDER